MNVLTPYSRWKPTVGSKILQRPKGLVGFWLMNDRAGSLVHDLSGNGNTGTCVAEAHFVTSERGSCLLFDGAGDYVDTGHIYSELNVTNNYSVSFWVNFVDVTSRNSGLLSQLLSSSSRFSIAPSNSVAPEILFGHYDGASWNSVKADTPVTEGTWYHFVAINYADKSKKIYRNGVDDTAAGAAVSPGSVVQNFHIGRTGTYYASALIDNVMIYNRALSASEVQRLYCDPWYMFRGDPHDMISLVSEEAGGAVPLAGSVAGQSAMSGALNATKLLVGNTGGSSSVSAVLSIEKSLVGSTAAQSVVTGSLLTYRKLAGLLTSQSSVSGALTVTATGYTLDTSHPLYSSMVGIYVFDNRANDGDNIAGTGTMVGTSEGESGFDTPITQSFQDWYNSFGEGYTVCIWHDGMTLGAWEGIFVIYSAGDGAALSWQRNNLVDEIKVFHEGTGVGMAGLNMADIANPQMLALRWNEAYCAAYDDGVWIAHVAHGTDPKTDCSDAAIAIAGQCTVTRVYIFDTAVDSDALVALAADPDSIFTISGEVTLFGSTASQSVVTGSMSLVVSLAGSFAAVSASSAAISVGVGITGLIAGISAVTGCTVVVRGVGGLIDAVTALSGDLTITRNLQGSVASQSNVTCNVSVTRRLQGSIASQSSVAGAVAVDKKVQGIITAQSTVTSVLSIQGSIDLQGSITSQSVVAGSLSVSIELQGSIASQSSLSGKLSKICSLAGSTEAQSSISGALSLGIEEELVGSIAAVSTVMGELITTRKLHGALTSQSVLSGNLTIGEEVDLAGSLIISSNTQGILKIAWGLHGALTAESNIVSSLVFIWGLEGSSTFQSSFTGRLSVAAAPVIAEGTLPQSTILAGYLKVQGLFSDPSEGDEWPIFTRRFPEASDVENNLACLYDIASIVDGKDMRGTEFERHGLQLRVRGINYSVAAAKIATTIDALKTVTGETVTIEGREFKIHNVQRLTTSHHLVRDEKRRDHFVTDLLLSYSEQS